MNAKEYLDKTTALKPFTKVPPPIVELCEYECDEVFSNRSFLLIYLLNNCPKTIKCYTNLLSAYYKFPFSKRDKDIQEKWLNKWPTIKLLSDMVRSGILDKYRG